MTIGVGGSTAAIELEKIQNMTLNVKPIQPEEYQARIKKAVALMEAANYKALYLNAGTNLYYFTGTKWNPSERMVGAVLFQDGTLEYIVPKFEDGTFKKFMQVEGNLNCWEEHESPYDLFGKILRNKNIHSGTIALDESANYFLIDGVTKANPNYEFVNGQPITTGCRIQKSVNEIAIIQQAKEITMVVQKAAARILRPGISVKEVTEFINEAHIKAGATAGSYFCIVLFSDDSQYPHGVTTPQDLKDNDIVLIDTGCRLEGYLSDITRTYVYGTPTEAHRKIWNLEKATQKAAFDAAQLGATCGSVDDAARKNLKEAGLSPDYEIPGLPHRVGHGTGLDIHEHPYLVRGNKTVLQEGMVISNEPMICIPGQFGIRHEDHFYMTPQGPKWFTTPMESIDNPFGY
ncbi:M24 family metallopeptidase [Flavobacterium muglaense]|uniref:Aminopeptidase P family protein n=1 Tax=Flavobacterium muglaense TaxID=2764716 RepID=A0A923N197_9FLAO|nr:Xaa-Pro peptidase family protein [Flavobacterium muglaense]MBC5838400.1 aminopeptidase P family protein [Flavobacterium muglaense]MBC5844935.1 aminopeptidase P family protein [Flavobacterium muglaense]